MAKFKNMKLIYSLYDIFWFWSYADFLSSVYSHTRDDNKEDVGLSILAGSIVFLITAIIRYPVIAIVFLLFLTLFNVQHVQALTASSSALSKMQGTSR
jgi:hypothetical protein